MVETILKAVQRANTLIREKKRGKRQFEREILDKKVSRAIIYLERHPLVSHVEVNNLISNPVKVHLKTDVSIDENELRLALRKAGYTLKPRIRANKYEINRKGKAVGLIFPPSIYPGTKVKPHGVFEVKQKHAEALIRIAFDAQLIH